MMKTYVFPKRDQKKVESWLTENISKEGVRWWSFGETITESGRTVYQVHIELTEEEEPRLTWFLLANR